MPDVDDVEHLPVARQRQHVAHGLRFQRLRVDGPVSKCGRDRERRVSDAEDTSASERGNDSVDGGAGLESIHQS
jgi:hypothetical protein